MGILGRLQSAWTALRINTHILLTDMRIARQRARHQQFFGSYHHEYVVRMGYGIYACDKCQIMFTVDKDSYANAK